MLQRVQTRLAARTSEAKEAEQKTTGVVTPQPRYRTHEESEEAAMLAQLEKLSKYVGTGTNRLCDHCSCTCTFVLCKFVQVTVVQSSLVRPSMLPYHFVGILTTDLCIRAGDPLCLQRVAFAVT